jgi:hypothetical protein
MCWYHTKGSMAGTMLSRAMCVATPSIADPHVVNPLSVRAWLTAPPDLRFLSHEFDCTHACALVDVLHDGSSPHRALTGASPWV